MDVEQAIDGASLFGQNLEDLIVGKEAFTLGQKGVARSCSSRIGR
jgi:hypothetical protein